MISVVGAQEASPRVMIYRALKEVVPVRVGSARRDFDRLSQEEWFAFFSQLVPHIKPGRWLLSAEAGPWEFRVGMAKDARWGYKPYRAGALPMTRYGLMNHRTEGSWETEVRVPFGPVSLEAWIAHWPIALGTLRAQVPPTAVLGALASEPDGFMDRVRELSYTHALRVA